MTAPTKAFQFIADSSVVVLAVKAGVLLIARNSLTVRPLRKGEGAPVFKTYEATRTDNN